jgi:RNA polymerase sigma-B factor
MSQHRTGPDSEYADLRPMFAHLATLEPGTSEFARQRDAIIKRCLPLADHIARRFANRGQPLDDLVQVARVGLVNAVNRFNVQAGSDFLSFAVPTMMGEVRRYFRDYSWSLKVPRRFKDLTTHLNRGREDLSHTLGRAPNASELADYLGIDREEVLEGLIAADAYSTVSTDVPVSATDDKLVLSDQLGSEDANIERMLTVQALRPLITALPDRERLVLRLRFFDNMSQTQIAEQIGVSQMHVSRILARSIAVLREQLEDVESAAA